MNEETKKEIYKLLKELKETGELFNQLGGALWSSVLADKLTKIHVKLSDAYDITVEYVQPCPGRVKFVNLDSPIEQYRVD